MAIRLTPEEAAELTGRYGTPGKGLRVALNRLLGQNHPAVRAEALRAKMDEKEPARGVEVTGRADTIEGIAAVMQIPKELLTVADIEAEALRALPQEDDHLHRRGDVVRTKYERGVQIKVYACAACGKEMG